MQFLLLMIGAIVFSIPPLFAMDQLENNEDSGYFLLFPFSDDFLEKESQKPFPIQRQTTVKPIVPPQSYDQPNDQLPLHFKRSASLPCSSAKLQQKNSNYAWDD